MSVNDIFAWPIAILQKSNHDEIFILGVVMMEIGKTRAGTIIRYKPNQDIEEFKSEFLNLADGDKFDYYCVYQWLVVKALPKKELPIDDYE